MSRWSAERKAEIIATVGAAMDAGAPMSEAVRDLPPGSPSYSLVYSWFRDRKLSSAQSYGSRKLRAQVANANEALEHLERVQVLLDRLDSDDLSVSASQAQRHLALTQQWVDDLRVCLRVDGNVPETVDFRRGEYGGVEQVAL